MSKASETYFSGKWNYSSIQVDGIKDEAEISILCHDWSKPKKFKVKDYSKGQDKWKIIEDEE